MPSRRHQAQQAFRNQDLSSSKEAHSRSSIAKDFIHSEDHQHSGKYLRDAVYGAQDGIVTTFAAISGVVGANVNLTIILIVGLANILADGISMAAGNYLSTKSEQEYHKNEYEREKWELKKNPEGEIEEIRQIYKAKGFSGKELENAVKIITSDEDRWIKTMMLEELGISPENKSPFRAALVTYVAFIVCGFIPLITFIFILFFPFVQDKAFISSIIITTLAIFVIGSLRSRFIAKHWFMAGLEMLLVAGTAAAVAYGIGFVLRDLI